MKWPSHCLLKAQKLTWPFHVTLHKKPLTHECIKKVQPNEFKIQVLRFKIDSNLELSTLNFES